MKSEVKDRWTAALRSGGYVQGTDALCENGKYCCLGVLNDIQGNSFVVRKADGVRSRSYFNHSDLFVSGINLGWLETQGVTVSQSMTLTRMNNSGKPFDEIADWIEENI